jgi:hypothetical protein
MRFEFKPSFDRSVKSFHGREKEEIKQVSVQAIDILSQDRVIHKGIGLKRLKGDLVEFILAGDHNDIRRYLKNI